MGGTLLLLFLFFLFLLLLFLLSSPHPPLFLLLFVLLLPPSSWYFFCLPSSVLHTCKMDKLPLGRVPDPWLMVPHVHLPRVYIFSVTGSLSPPESLDPFAFPADNGEDRVALDKSHPSLRLALKQNQHKLGGVNKLLLIFPTNQTDGLRQLPRT